MKDKDRVTKITACRICKEKTLQQFLSFGPMPLANGFLREEQLDLHEPSYPLDVCFCPTCGLVQLRHAVAPEILFKEYAYLTSASEPARLHFAKLAEEVIQKFSVPPNSLVIDIGSNDGTLLQSFQRYGMRSLGIEPASNVAEVAVSRGIDTVNDFFSERLAHRLRSERVPAKIITATNLFAHVHDLDSLLRGVNYLLSEDGIFVIEVPYLIDMLEKLEFDTIYHEHLSYFSVRPLVTILTRFNMNIVEVERISSAGGSIRIYIEKSAPGLSSTVNSLLKLEREKGIESIEVYQKFSQEIHHIKETLLEILHSLKARGASIAGYGAAAKGNILLNCCEIGADVLDYIVDTTPFKQGSYSPGMHIPICPESRFREEPPDYALLLAWNYADAIIAKEAEYHRAGGRFIVPIPKPRLV